MSARDELAEQVAAHGPFPMPTGDPLIVSRFDTATEPAPEEEPVLIVGAVADDGRPVALLLDLEARSKVARWLAPELEETGLASPWERAVAGLNALVDADVAFHVEPDGHISNLSGDEHIEWDHDAARWRLVHDDEEDSAHPPHPDPCRPCGCPKRFNRHAEGCHTECPSCAAPADVTGYRIPTHRSGCPRDEVAS